MHFLKAGKVIRWNDISQTCLTFNNHNCSFISLLYCSIKAFGSILDSLENLDFQFDLLTKIRFGIVHRVQLDLQMTYNLNIHVHVHVFKMIYHTCTCIWKCTCIWNITTLTCYMYIHVWCNNKWLAIRDITTNDLL